MCNQGQIRAISEPVLHQSGSRSWPRSEPIRHSERGNQWQEEPSTEAVGDKSKPIRIWISIHWCVVFEALLRTFFFLDGQTCRNLMPSLGNLNFTAVTTQSIPDLHKICALASKSCHVFLSIQGKPDNSHGFGVDVARWWNCRTKQCKQCNVFLIKSYKTS